MPVSFLSFSLLWLTPLTTIQARVPSLVLLVLCLPFVFVPPSILYPHYPKTDRCKHAISFHLTRSPYFCLLQNRRLALLVLQNHKRTQDLLRQQFARFSTLSSSSHVFTFPPGCGLIFLSLSNSWLTLLRISPFTAVDVLCCFCDAHLCIVALYIVGPSCCGPPHAHVPITHCKAGPGSKVCKG